MNTSTSYSLTDRGPEEIIAHRQSGPVTVGELVGEAIALAALLPDHQFVFNLHTDRYRYLRGFCAAIIAGQCTLMPPNRQAQTLEQMQQDYPDAYLMDADSTGDRVLQNVVVASRREAYPRIPAAQLCAIAFTSGSTGTPTPNNKSWEALRSGSLNNKRMILGDLSEPINLIATVPAQHMWGFEASVLLPLFASVAVGNVCPFFPLDIAEALAAIPQPRGLISSPTHLDVISRSDVQLPDIQRIFTASAPLPKTLASQLEDEFDTEVVEVFGSSESGMIATRRPTIDELWNLSAGFELVPGQSGFELHAEHLSASVHVPDIVEMVGERQFRWLGRHQDVVNIAGKRGSFGDLNQRLLAVPGVEDGIIFLPEGREDRLAALVVAPDLRASDIVEALQPQVDPVFLPRTIYLVEALPRQESGKLASSAVNALFSKLRE